MGATIWIPLTVTPYGDRLEPQTTDYVPDLIIKNVLELSEILLPPPPKPTPEGSDGVDDAGDVTGVVKPLEPGRSLTMRPFRSLSTGNAKLTHMDDNGNRSLDKSLPRRFAMSMLADLDTSCSSNSSSAEFS